MYSYLKSAGESLSAECQEYFKQNDPSTCCVIPRHTPVASTSKICSDKCKDLSSSERDCCVLDCVYEEEKIYVDEKFDQEKFIELHEKSIIDPTKQAEWKPLIRKAFDSCEELSKTTIQIFIHSQNQAYNFNFQFIF